MEHLIHNEEELRAYATAFAVGLRPHTRDATVVTLSGELGVGKTTFAQAVARTLGVEETVASPTFVLEKVYSLSGQPFERLVHIDAYRLKGPQELAALNWQKRTEDPANLILLEWPERVADIVPHDAIRISFEIRGEERILRVHGSEEKNSEGGGR